MIKFAQLTIYEGFGYFLPGAVLVAALGIIAWAVWAPCVPLPIFAPSFDLWALLIVVAYFAGHAVQGAGNALLDYYAPLQKLLSKWIVSKTVGNWIEKLFGPQPAIAAPTEALAICKAKKLLEPCNTDSVDFAFVESLANEALVQLGNSAEMDVYVYREGFYRGSCISFTVLAVALWIRGAIAPTQLRFWGRCHELYASELICLCVLCILTAWLFWRRFNRFGQIHRITSLLGLLLLGQRHAQKPKPAGKNTRILLI